ncbi:WD repeat-containing protein 43 [Sarcoptes scabiei]|uniref:WD repeat-containing protein 43 n=2 Tax=Sarcoptes scabiei TaxID=52283 RepID=A0A834REN9_SARSC|nr:WD repeat-containing protein 43 [Sarcoptes scabiei]
MTLANGDLFDEMATSSGPMAVSPCGRYFAITSLAGHLNVWDTLTADLVSQYLPSSHLSAKCIKISWPDFNSNAATQSMINGSDSKLLDIQYELQKHVILALGIENGSVFLFSVVKNEIVSILNDEDNGHTKRIYDICWLSSADSLFTCSKDNKIIEWSISQASIKSQAILDRSRITSICVIDQDNIVTGSNLIKWWNWPKKQLIKTFNGHSNEIKLLKPIRFESDQNYIVSSARSDRFVYLWNLDVNSRDLNPSGCLQLDEEPISLELEYTDFTKPIFIMSVSKTGYFYLFEHQIKSLSSMICGPMAPKFRIEIRIKLIFKNNLSNGSLSNRKKKKHQDAEKLIPFLYAHRTSHNLHPDKAVHQFNSTSIIYGSVEKPMFEILSLHECENLCKFSEIPNQGIIYKDPSLLKSMSFISAPKIINMSTETKIKHFSPSSIQTVAIGPFNIAPNQPVFNNINEKISNNNEVFRDDKNNNLVISPKKSTDKSNSIEIPVNGDDIKFDHHNADKIEDMTLDDRLKLIERNKNQIDVGSKSSVTVSKSKKPQSTDSLVNILIQGLQSNDVKMLSTVLQNENSDSVISNTVKRLPIEFVPILLNQLQNELCRNGENYSNYLKWITLLLRHKISYLMTIPNISEKFSPLNQLLNARTTVLDKCYQLKGRLDLILTQTKIESKKEKISFMKPKITYESDSSDDSDLDLDTRDDSEENDQIDDFDLENEDESEHLSEDENDEESEQSDDNDEDDRNESEDESDNESNNRSVKRKKTALKE